MLRPIAASDRIRNGISTPVNTYGVAASGTDDERDGQHDRDRDPVLPDREDRVVVLVGRLELSGFAVEHGG
jgi:hypothetical protein